MRRLQVPAVATGAAALVILVAFLLPGAQGHNQTTPPSILFAGLIQGLAVALTAAALVLVYQLTRVINFAQLAIGVAGAVICFNFVYLLPFVPFPIAVLTGLIGGALFGIVFEISFGRRFAKAPRLVLTLATVFAAAWLTDVGAGIGQGLPFFPQINQRTGDQIAGTADIRTLLPFSGFHFQVGSLPLPYGFPEVVALVLAPLLLIGLGVFLHMTRLGKAVRAAAENTERAALLGISVGWLAFLVWAVAGVFSSASLIISGITIQPSVVYHPTPEQLLAPIAAAVLARMKSVYIAAVAAVAYGIASAAVNFQQPDMKPLLDVALFVALSVGLVMGGRRLARGGDASAWTSNKEVRPMPREMAALPAIRIAKWVAIVAGLGAVLAFPLFVGQADVSLGGVLMLSGIVILSLVVLTGWAGQASAGQFALVAVGAVAGAVITSKAGLSFYLAVPLATIVTALLATVLAFPALRIQGLFLLASTFAFATMARSLLFSDKFLPFLQTGPLTRPTLFLVDFDDERSMYYLTVAALVLAILVVVNLRRSRFGRILIGVRDNEANARSAGVSPVRTRVLAFALAGGLAGFAGAIFAFHQRQVIPTSFEVTQSLLLLETAVLGGSSSIGGSLFGLFLLDGLARFFNTIAGVGAALGFLPLLILYISPAGLAAIMQSLRDAILRIIAERRQMVVPSLFADIDPESLHLRLVPLANPLPSGGLQLIRERFEIAASRLSRQSRAALRPGRGREAAILAAAGSAETASPEGVPG